MTLNQHEAVRKAVDLSVNEIERYDKNEEKTVDVWIFVLPELIFERCKPLARRSGLDLTTGQFSKGKGRSLISRCFAMSSTRPQRRFSTMCRIFIGR